MNAKRTDISKVRSKAIMLLNLPMIGSGSFYVNHPFFQLLFELIDDKYYNLTDREDLQEVVRLKTECINHSNAEEIFQMIRMPYRLMFLDLVWKYLNPKLFSKILENTWIMTENPSAYKGVSLDSIKEMFLHADKKQLMSAKEFKKYQNLPSKVILYRGVQSKSNPNGFSWTPDIKTAKWFAERYEEDNGYILKVEMPKERIFACFDSRNESEIVCDPRRLKKLRVC